MNIDNTRFLCCQVYIPPGMREHIALGWSLVKILNYGQNQLCLLQNYCLCLFCNAFLYTLICSINICISRRLVLLCIFKHIVFCSTNEWLLIFNSSLNCEIDFHYFSEEQLYDFLVGKATINVVDAINVFSCKFTHLSVDINSSFSEI